MKEIAKKISNPETLRFVLALTFFGHALVNFGFSPLIGLHTNLVNTANKILGSFIGWQIPVDSFLTGLGIAEIIVTILLVAGWGIRWLIPVLIGYLTVVGLLAYTMYYFNKQSFFGFAEVMRRLPWIFTAIALYLWRTKRELKPNLVRIGLAFAFLAHGTASLGLLGFNKGHIDLAVQVVPEEYARDFVFYTGISDTIIGLSLLTGIGARWLIFPALLWILFVVIVSFIFAISDGIFRLGFLLMALWTFVYLWKDKLLDEQPVKAQR
ncbi:MAG: hypothetical protein GXO48_08985 [Chlorobi bacterium]|nr:hypothetical protein [Chlorobiota bacterium]